MGGHVERRERVARIIDPEAWVLRGWNDNWREVKARKQEIALEKADVILSAHRQTIEALVGALSECEDYLDNRADVKDGDYGIPEPNKEMTLLSEVRSALLLAGEKNNG